MARLTIQALRKRSASQKLVMITAYDAPSARLADLAADILLVGDSVATTVQGRGNTIAVTMDEMIYHTSIVARCSSNALLVGDMPFLSYQVSADQAVVNAGRFLKEGGAGAVKLEGGAGVVEQVQAIVKAGIPVMGHLGFTPQSELMTGIRVNRDETALISDAKLLEAAGAFAIVLELVPAAMARAVTAAVSIPTIGIGAGPHCSGQVLVFHDLLGFNPDFKPKFVKRYMDFHGEAMKALAAFRADVESGAFPAKDQSFE